MYVYGSFHLRDKRPLENVFFIVVWDNTISAIEMQSSADCEFKATFRSPEYVRSRFIDSVLSEEYLFVLSLEDDKPYLLTFVFA